MKNTVSISKAKYFLSLTFCLIISANIFSTDTIENVSDPKEMKISEDDRIKRIFLQSAKTHYLNSDWLKAKYAYHNYLILADGDETERDEALFYYAKSCLNASDYFTAIESYTEFLAHNTCDEKLSAIAEWDRAVAAIKIDRLLAQKFLNDIAHNPGHSYQKEARGIVRIL